MNRANILVVDDEKDIVSALKIYLSADSYHILTASNGLEALTVMQQEPIHLVLLDIMMPVMDGMTCAAKIREFSNVPIIFLSAKSEDQDKIAGLNVGADDYIGKPFNPDEVRARVRSQLRRFMQLGGHSESADLLSCGPIQLDSLQKQVTVDGERVALTPIEFQILKHLMSQPGRVYTSDEIYEAVWDCPAFGADRTIAVHIRHLREKIEINPSEPRWITVVWGQGYRLTPDSEVGGK